jgi:hypothetical protein
VLRKQGVAGAIPATSTNHLPANQSLTNSAVARLPQFGSIWVQLNLNSEVGGRFHEDSLTDFGSG